MNVQTPISTSNSEITLADVIKIAILAVGGQGGGVLTNWIADLASRGGYDVQMTSVAGVAQRTGATIYYVEMAPKASRLPVFAQSPAPGDVDIMIAAELMEAGRSVVRGFVTPDRTTLIASTHRILAVSEKEVPGDGRSDSELVADEIIKASLTSVCFDMQDIAAQSGSVISSSLFGGLAKSGALPFDTTLFEDVIKASGRGVEQSLKAFRATLDYDENAPPQSAAKTSSTTSVEGPDKLLRDWKALIDRVNTFDPSSRFIVEAGLQKVVDYQDIEYGREYLDHLVLWQKMDSEAQGFELTKTAAKYIANAMCYDDIMRVADLKIRASRNKRLRGEQGVDEEAIVHVTEYFHPRAHEICGSMPKALGAWFERSPRAFGILDRLVNKGRRIRTDRIRGFLMLRTACFLKPYRRKLLRHQQEMKHITRLLEIAKRAASSDYNLAIEVLSCQRLVKGYSDTHVRGHSKFAKVMGAVDKLEGRDDAAEWVRRLREVALNDEKGEGLDGAIQTVASFAA